MEKHPLIANEEARLAALRNLNLLDTAPSEAYDRITRIAARLLRVPVSSISLLDRDRQYFKSRVGFDMLEAPRREAPCDWAIRSDAVMTVPDMLADERFESTPLVRRDGIRAYAGAPLITRSGNSLGTLCVFDTRPRAFTNEETDLLADLAQMVMSQIELQNSIGRIHPVSGRPNEYQLIDELDDLAQQSSGVSLTALLIEISTTRQVRQGMRVLGANFVEHLAHSALETIRIVLSPQERLYHIGATRCVVLLSEADESCWRALTQRLGYSLREPVDCDGILVRAEPAIGVHTFRAGSVAPRDVLRRLYSATEDAREAGTLTAIYDARQDNIHARRFQLLSALPDALRADDQLSLVFQPRVDLSGRPRGAEALLRWRHPQYGDISPAEFVPLVEETAHIGPLTQWVLNRALGQMGRWRLKGCRFRVSINVSAPNLEEPDFAGSVVRLLAQYDVPPDAIELEFTESAVVRNDVRVIEQLSELRSMGIEIAIDDFGTGYSSLAYLQKLPASVLKIDRTFIKDLPTSVRDRKLVSAMISMAHDLGYRVVAEGVDSEESVALLKEWGCDEAQGYHFSKPLTVSDMVRWLDARS